MGVTRSPMKIDKKRFLIVLLIIVLAVLAVFWSRPLSKKPTSGAKKGATPASPFGAIKQPLPTPAILPTGTEKNLFYTMTFPADSLKLLPKALPVYRKGSLSAEVEGRRLASLLGFGQPSQTNAKSTVYVSEGKGLLRVLTETGSLEYFRDYGQKREGSTPLNSLREAAQSFLFEHGLYPAQPDQIKETGVAYYAVEGLHISKIASFESADFVQFSFQPLLQGYPLVANDRRLEPTQVSVNFMGGVTAVVHQFFSVRQLADQSAVYTLKSGEQILKEVGQRKLQIESFEGPPYQTADFQSVRLSEVFTAYLWPLPNQELVVPVFVFKGGGSLKNGQPFTASFYLHAVADMD